MKLKTKLTALCAVLLFAVAASLTAAMLWLVREQSYQSLAQNSKRTMDTLTSSFFNSASRNVLKDLPPGFPKSLSDLLLSFLRRFRQCPGGGWSVPECFHNH